METVTGVTTFKLQQEIDTGNILPMDEILIGREEMQVNYDEEIGQDWLFRPFRA
jgi:methionyl-tRNA formyltransferase